MRYVYPRRFSLEGSIDLTYKDYSTTVKYRREYKHSYSTFKQQYSLGVKGFIYHPKLLVFSTRLTFADDRTLRTTAGLKPNSQSYIYELSTVFLPYRPINLTTYTTIADYTFGGLDGDSIYDMRIINYGAILGMKLKNLPLIRFEYYHLNMEPTGRRRIQETTNDSFYLNIRGLYSKLRTQYSFNLGYSDIKTMHDGRKYKFVNIYTNTNLKKFTLINFFRYYDQELSKTFGIHTNIQPRKWKGLTHEYYYSYEKFEEESEDITRKTDRQEIRGFFTYRFTKSLYSSLSLDYGTFTEKIKNSFFDEVNEAEKKFKFHAVVASLNYSKPFKKYYLFTFYRFLQRDDEFKGKYNQHSFNLELKTRRFRWGTVYTSYTFNILDGTFKIYEEENPHEFIFEEEVKEGKYKNITHTFTLGVRGKAFKKAPWSLEAEYYNAKSSKERPKKYFGYNDDFFESSILKTEIKRDFYVFLGEIMYPIGRKGSNLNFRTGYSFGEIDSIHSSKYFYEIKFSLPYSKNLRFQSWWREIWYNYDITYDRKVREYDLTMIYRIGKLYLNAEYWVQNQKDDSRDRNYRRFIIKLRRSFK